MGGDVGLLFLPKTHAPAGAGQFKGAPALESRTGTYVVM